MIKMIGPGIALIDTRYKSTRAKKAHPHSQVARQDMSTTPLSPIPPATSAPGFSFDRAGGMADPFLSILDAAATRATLRQADSDDLTSTPGREEEPRDDEDPIDEPEPPATNETAQSIVLPIDPRVIAATAPAGQQGAVATPTDKQQLLHPINGKPTAPNGAAESAARLTPSPAAATGDTRPNANPPSSTAKGGSDINLQVTHDDVKSKPTTMLTTTEAAAPKTAQKPELDLRAERYADLRTNPNNRPGGEVRLSDLGGQSNDRAAAAKTVATPSSQNSDPSPGRMMALINAAGDTPTPPPPVAATNGSQPPAVGLSTSPGSAGAGAGALLATPDAASPNAAITRPVGSPADIARTTTSPHSQPTTTAKAVEQIAVQIKNGVNSGADKIHVRLQPAALGRVDIQIEVGHDQRVQAVIVVEKAETLEVLERDARHLHRMLEDAGFRTGSDSLTFRQQAAPDDQKSDGRSPGMTDADEPSEQTTDAAVRLSPHDGLLDVEV